MKTSSARNEGGLSKTFSVTSIERPQMHFNLGRVLSRNGPHGTVVRASVADSIRKELGTSSVAVKVLPIYGTHSDALIDRVRLLRRMVSCPNLVSYVGAWSVGDETWLVSDLCESGSVIDVPNYADSEDIESIVAYVVQQTLLSLTYLHTELLMPHGDIRPGNILIGDDLTIRLSDYGVYDCINCAMQGRKSYSGSCLWPVPEVAQKGYDEKADIWALGGSAAVARTKRSGRRIPRLPCSTHWSTHLNDFIMQTFVASPRFRPSAAELLQHQFVVGASSSALQTVVDRAMAVPTGADKQHIYNQNDVVAKLYRASNICMQLPLIEIDDIPTDVFILKRHNRFTRDRPAVEQSLLFVSERLKHIVDVGRAESKTAYLQSSSTIMQWLDIANRRPTL